MEQEKKEHNRTLDALANSMGREIVGYMHDDNINEVALNTDQRLWIDTADHGWEDTGIIIPPPQAKRIIYGVAALSGTTIDIDNKPYLEAEIKESYLFGKARFQGELPSIVDYPSFNIRKHSSRVFGLDDYVRQGTMSEHQRDVIIQAVKNHWNIIAAGGTSSGKTTLLNAVLAEVSKTGDRIVIIEDTGELQCTAPNHVNLKTQRPMIDMDRLSIQKGGIQVHATACQGQTLKVYDIVGKLKCEVAIDSNDKTIRVNLSKGIYLINIGQITRRVNIAG